MKIKILSGPEQTIQPAAAARPHRVSRSDISDQAVSSNYYSLGSVGSVFYFAEREISATNNGPDCTLYRVGPDISLKG